MQQARGHNKVHESLVIRRKTIAALSGLDQGTSPRQRLIDWPMRFEISQSIDPAQQLVAQHDRHIGTLQELCQDRHRPREVVPYPNDDLKIIVEDPHQPYVSRRDIWGAQERLARSEGRVKLPGRHLQLEALWDGEARDIGRREEAPAEGKRLEIREPRVTRKAVLGESLEQETGLRILPLGVALGRVVGTSGQRVAQKTEALWHILAMRVELLGVLGKGPERRLDALTLLWRLKLLGIETPGKDAGQGLEELVHGGLDIPTWGAVLRHRLPREEESQDNEKRCKSHRAWSCVHGLYLLSYAE